MMQERSSFILYPPEHPTRMTEQHMLPAPQRRPEGDTYSPHCQPTPPHIATELACTATEVAAGASNATGKGGAH